MDGWIKLHRELMDKAIWTDTTPQQKAILITLIMMANHKQKQWLWKGEKYVCEPGQFITSLPNIAKKSGKGVSIQNVRTALKLFETLEFLTDQSTGKGRLITIVNWGKYQIENDETNSTSNRQLTDNQQTTNRQLTANKNDNNNKNIKDIVEQSDVTKIVDYLNAKLGSKYLATTRKTIDLVRARLNEGATVDDFYTVIDKKYDEWHNDPRMVKFLRPETLFGTKFEGYLNQIVKPPDRPPERRTKFHNFDQRTNDDNTKALIRQITGGCG